MISYWGICILFFSIGYARYTDKTQDAAQSIGNAEPGNALVQDGEDLQRSSENSVMRRRITYRIHTGSANHFSCYGSNQGKWAPAFNFHQRPFAALVRTTTTTGIGRLLFYYKIESTGKSYYVGGGVGGTHNRFMSFGLSPSGCIDRMDFRLDSRLTLNGMRLFFGSKYLNWYGSQVGYYYSVRAPTGRCLGDVRMRTSVLGVNYLCLRFNAYKCVACGLNQRTVCDKHGRKPRQCSLIVKKCAYGYYLRYGRCQRCTRCSYGYVQVSSCTQTQNTVCKLQRCRYGQYMHISYSGVRTCVPCKRCSYGYTTKRQCSGTQNTVCERNCRSGYYLRNGYCQRCKRCYPGWILIRRCTKTQDTVCMYCRWCRKPSILPLLG